jgi:hypothetical protein
MNIAKANKPSRTFSVGDMRCSLFADSFQVFRKGARMAISIMMPTQYMILNMLMVRGADQPSRVAKQWRYTAVY